MTVSLGTATFASGGDIAVKASINCADDALYRCKAGGRNRMTSGGVL